MTAPKKPKLSEHLRQRTREWFRKAEHDLTYLEHAPLDVDDPPTDTTGRLAHMVAEYCLKAYLMLNKKKIKKIHELGKNWILASQPDKTRSLKTCEMIVRFLPSTKLI